MSLTISDVVLEGSSVAIRAVDGVITEIGPHVEAEQGDDVLTGGGRAVVPGLVNGHWRWNLRPDLFGADAFGFGIGCTVIFFVSVVEPQTTCVV